MDPQALGSDIAIARSISLRVKGAIGLPRGIADSNERMQPLLACVLKGSFTVSLPGIHTAGPDPESVETYK